MYWELGGDINTTGKIGYMNVLRQEYMLPGTSCSPSINGFARLSPMREQKTSKIHAHLEAFITPVRWLWTDFPQYLVEGKDTSLSPPKVTIKLDDYGLGAYNDVEVFQWFKDAPLRVYNEYVKWPENDDITAIDLTQEVAVALPAYYTRLQNQDHLSSDHYELETKASGEREKFDLRDLSKQMARYRNEVPRDWIVHGRYNALVKDAYGARGNNEVDKVPFSFSPKSKMLSGRNQWATDGDNLGGLASIHDFDIKHNFGQIHVAEHSILTFILIVRFPSVANGEVNPVAVAHGKEWEDIVGDAGILANRPPVSVSKRELDGKGTTDHWGYLPSGWQYRARWSNVGKAINERSTFPLLGGIGAAASVDRLRDANRILDCFRSDALDHYLVDADFNLNASSDIGDPNASLYAGG